MAGVFLPRLVLCQPALKNGKTPDHTENGAPPGVNDLFMISHGSSKAKEISKCYRNC